MNIMDKPTLKQVRKYFKNAKEVRCLFDLEIYNISEWDRYFDNGDYDYWVEKDKSGKQQAQLFEDGKYAEIISYKEPLYKLTSKEVVHAFENPQWLKDTFKECFKTDLEVNRWYNVNEISYKGIIFITELELCDGFRKVHFYGIINDKFRIDYIANKGLEQLLQPATEKEVEEALQKEAINRGFKEGVKYKNATMPTQTETLKSFKDLRYNTKTTQLTDGYGGSIFYKGNWAKISLPTYTIPEAESKFNIKIINPNV